MTDHYPEHGPEQAVDHWDPTEPIGEFLIMAPMNSMTLDTVSRSDRSTPAIHLGRVVARGVGLLPVSKAGTIAHFERSRAARLEREKEQRLTRKGR